MKKYQKVEKEQVLTPGQHQTVSSELKKEGKHSVADLTVTQRKDLTDKVDNSK